jgi:hypothetical protein
MSSGLNLYPTPTPTPDTSSQKLELIAFTKALELRTGKKNNIYMDTKCAFATAHVHGAMYQERGLLISEGKEIKNKQEILDLLDALMKLTSVSIIHCPGHQKGRDSVTWAITRQIKWFKKWLCSSLSQVWACMRYPLGNGTALRDSFT